MPFIVQCENPTCRTYNLVEDALCGQSVECLICKTAFRADNAIRACPQCAAKMRVPCSAAAQRVQCPKCGTVFQ